MALVLADRVLETTTTAGSGTITLVGAEPGYQSFSAVGDGNQTYYTITGDTEWEVGIGTYTASGTTLSRDTVLSSSDSGAKVTFSAGIKKVFVTYPSEKSVNFTVSGNITAATGKIINVGEPTDAADAATKLYVDTLVATGITYHSPVKYEVPSTTGNLVATYNNGTAGVSATLTNAGTLAAFVPDGVTATISDRVLVYNQTNAFENGVYTVTTVGDGSTSWVLTRAADADTYALKSPNSLGGGDAFFVTSGNTGAGETYLCNNSGVISFGSTAISFVQISSAQVYSAGNGLSLTNTVFSLATPVAVANGGTGVSTAPGNGELLIGNGSGYTLATLTAGSGVSITNSAGSITLSATGLGGTVTAVTATGPLASSGGTAPNISIANSTGTGSVVLDNGPIIYSATITGAVSASITTLTGTNLSYGSATITTGNLIVSSGNVGIGLTPTASVGALQVSGGAFATSTMYVGQAGSTAFSGGLQNLSNTSRSISLEADPTNAGANTVMYFNLDGSTRMAIDSSGNVGIGTASPYSGAGVKTLQVTGSDYSIFQQTTDTATADYKNWRQIVRGSVGGHVYQLQLMNDANSAEQTVYEVSRTANSVTYQRWFGGTSEAMRINSSGNVGIGTTTAAAGGLLTLNRAPAAAFGTPMLQVGGASFTSSGYYSIGLGFTDATYTEPPGEIVFITDSSSGGTNGAIAFGTRSVTTNTAVTERFRFGPSGQLGIGGANYGTSGQVLTSNGSGSAPSWQAAGGLPAMTIVTGTTQSASANNHYVLTNASATTVTLPASPAAGDVVWVTVANGLTTNVVARNGKNINSIAEDMTIDNAYAGVQLRYADTTKGWVFT